MALALVSYGSSDDNSSDEEELDLSTAVSEGSQIISADIPNGGASIDPVQKHSVDFGMKNGIGDGHITDEDSDVANSDTSEEIDTVETIPVSKDVIIEREETKQPLNQMLVLKDESVNVHYKTLLGEPQTLHDGARVVDEKSTNTEDDDTTSEERQPVIETHILKNITTASEVEMSLKETHALKNGAATTKEKRLPAHESDKLNDNTNYALKEVKPVEVTCTAKDSVSGMQEESHSLKDGAIETKDEAPAIEESPTLKDDMVKETEPLEEILEKDTGHITDEEDEVMIGSPREKAQILHGTSVTKDGTHDTELQGTMQTLIDGPSETSNLPVGKPESAVSHSIQDLPAPKPHDVSIALASAQEDELEEIVKPKVSQQAGISKPVRRQPVKISAPILHDDDEEDTPSKKKPRLAAGRSGLSALLPAPMHEKDSNRPLIPYTLTKKAKSAAPTSKNKRSESKTAPARVHRKSSLPAATSILPGIDAGVDSGSSDDDEEDGNTAEKGPSSNFFSFTDKQLSPDVNETVSSSASVEPEPVLPVSFPIQRRSLNLPLPVHGGENKNKDSLVENKNLSHRTTSELDIDYSKLDNPLNKKSKTDLSVLKSSQKSSALSSSSLVPYSDDIDNEKMDVEHEEEEEDFCGSLGDAPLQFHGSVTAPYKPRAYSAGPSWRPQSYVGPHAQPSVGAVYSYGDQGSGDSANQDTDELRPLEQTEVEEYLHDSAFLKFQGKKDRGKQAISFIDAKPDYSGRGTELLKGISEESNIEYQAHRKKDNMPSSQQKRKHQITYLAFQAKERELDLKNQWAQNRQTKRQTQSKYGF